jgi:hypothetical protein
MVTAGLPSWTLIALQTRVLLPNPKSESIRQPATRVGAAPRSNQEIWNRQCPRSATTRESEENVSVEGAHDYAAQTLLSEIRPDPTVTDPIRLEMLVVCA